MRGIFVTKFIITITFLINIIFNLVSFANDEYYFGQSSKSSKAPETTNTSGLKNCQDGNSPLDERSTSQLEALCKKIDQSVATPTPAHEIPNLATKSQSSKGGLIITYHYPSGKQEIRTSGARAWRNNNPGNLIISDFSKRHGAIGDDGRFAVFPTMEHGIKALYALLKSWGNLSLQKAIYKYAPPSENNSKAYLAKVVSALKTKSSTTISSLNSSQLDKLVKAIMEKEGQKVGNINIKNK